MADDKKNIPDAGKVDNLPRARKSRARQKYSHGARTARPGQSGGSCGRGYIPGGTTPCGGSASSGG